MYTRIFILIEWKNHITKNFSDWDKIFAIIKTVRTHSDVTGIIKSIKLTGEKSRQEKNSEGSHLG